MDAAFIALLVTLPIIAVCVILWLWIRRSATPAAATRRKRALSVILLIPLALYYMLYDFHDLHGFLSFLAPYRSIVGISTVVLANNSGGQLNDVEIMMHTPNHHYTYRFGSLGSQRQRFALRASELAVDRIAFSLDARSVASTNVALAKRGQVLTVRIDPSGRIENETN